MTYKTLETVVRHQPGLTIIDLYGDIDGTADVALNEAYVQAEDADAKTIVLNFSPVGYINSTGIALIVGLLAKARQTRRHLATYGLSEHYLEIFQITRLADYMQIYTDEVSAIAGAEPSHLE